MSTAADHRSVSWFRYNKDGYMMLEEFNNLTNEYDVYAHSRYMYVGGARIEFGDCVRRTLSSSATEVVNGIIIPFEIYGAI